MDKNEIEFLKESNAIEGEYSEEAMKDSLQAWRFAHSMLIEASIPLDIDLICDIHGILIRNLNRRIAGKIRDCDVWVGGRKCFEPEKIKEQLSLLCGLPYPKDEEEIKIWHIHFEGIHPFEDGNGRIGRILMNIQRLKISLPLLIINHGKEQMEYYKWFK